MFDKRDTRLHWATEGQQRPLCGTTGRKLRIQHAYAWQMRRAMASSADSCAECQAFVDRWAEDFGHEETRAGYIAGLMAKEGLIE